MVEIITNPNWTDIENGCKYIARKIKNENPGIHYIVGITRGGLIPAVMISHLLKIPAVAVSYSSISGNGNDKFYNNVLPDIQSTINQNRLINDLLRILIVDDICDSGKTIGDVSTEYLNRGHEVLTATLYYKEDGSGFTPDYSWQQIPKDLEWITFPWEYE